MTGAVGSESLGPRNPKVGLVLGGGGVTEASKLVYGRHSPDTGMAANDQ
jgi:hypothetical protein